MSTVGTSPKAILEMQNITKRFPGVVALDDVSFRLLPGKVHALMGENGAGKSTLMKIIAGIHEPDEGKMLLRGEEVSFHRPKDAMDAGIAMIHQELSPIDEMAISENLFLGKEIRNKFGILDYPEMRKKSVEYMERIGFHLEPNKLMKDLSVSETQMVEIAKAVSYNADIIIMDEPSATLTTAEVEHLFKVIKDLKDNGVAIVYITHKMDEVFRIADEITVFRDGKYIGTYQSDEITENKLIRLMVDRELDEIYPTRNNRPDGEVLLEVKNLNCNGDIKDISFELRGGEILGFAGLMGAGRTELMDAIFGLRDISSGEIYVKGERVDNPRPQKMISKGIGYVTEDRKGNGLIMEMSVRDNVIISSLERLSKGGLINGKQAKVESEDYIGRLNIKTPTFDTNVNTLSGGNQQKTILAKWLMQGPDIIIFDEPTRGIDVGAKTEIYRLIVQLAEEGKGIIFISSEMPEVLGMSDRIIVLCEREYSGEVEGSKATQEILLTMATRKSKEMKELEGDKIHA